MATNADNEEVITSDEEDLRQAKEDLAKPTEELTSSEEGAQSEESPAEEEAPAEPDATLTTTPAETDKDLDWYKKAYGESTKEALRLKGELDTLTTPKVDAPVKQSEVTLTPEQLYIKQQQDKEIATAFADVTKNYPQVKDPEDYKKFTAMANTFGKTILDAENRLASPEELYSKTVIALGWTAEDNQEKLGAALKDSASSPKISSGSATGAPVSKVTDAMIATNRKMYPNKTDAEIREELEPHVQ